MRASFDLVSCGAVALVLFAAACGDDDAGDGARDGAVRDAIVRDDAAVRSDADVPAEDGAPPPTPTPPTPPTPPPPTPPTPPTPPSPPPPPPPPPPGAIEGYGAVTRGAESSPDGFADCHVTTLDDDGAGSLRDCLSEGNRRVVFDVGGTITLASDLNVRWSYVTIDGSTAPAPGITILQPAMINTVVEARASTGPAHDIVIRYLRMDGQATTHENAGDLWGLDGENAPVYNVVLDHLTGIASSDGVFDIWGDVHDVTLSWSLILDTVAALHMSTGDIAQARRRISVHHNVFARNNERQVRLRHDSGPIDFVSNVVYGWGWFESGGYGLCMVHDPGEANPSIAAIDNVFHFVPDLFADADDAIVFDSGADRGAVYFEGNIVPEGEHDQEMSTSGPIDVPGEARVTATPAAMLGTVVVPSAGTHHPTAAEQALLAEIADAI